MGQSSLCIRLIMYAAVLSVVLGVAAAAPQVFPHHAPLDQARNDFIREYNRLAALAAAAPDIHIIMRDPLDQLQPVPQAHTNQLAQPAFQGFDNFGFTANLGQNQNFVPTGHLAGHLAGHQVVQQAPVAPHDPTLRWTGPLADTVPAGVHGLPTQVTDTPAVAAAKQAHFAALNRAFRAAPGHV